MIVLEIQVFLCIHFKLNHTLGSFGNHASTCVIDGPRVEHYTPLSSLHDRKGVCAHIALKMHCHALFVLCCSKIAFCRKIWPAGHLQCRSPKHCWLRSSQMVDAQFHMADVPIFWPVTSHSAQGVVRKHPWDLCSFQRCRTVQTEATCGMATGFRARRPSMHLSLFSRPLSYSS